MEVGDHDSAVLDRIFNPLLPNSGDTVLSTKSDSIPVEEDDVISGVKKLERDGVEAAERGDLDCALEHFCNAVNTAPHWPSAYNNRAQVLRLKGDIPGAKRDLDRAIELSNSVGAAACQAYTQRALIRQYEGDTDSAVEDYKRAANLGSVFAKQQVVNLNPYAALCNQMLSDVFEKLKSGES